MEIIIKLKEKTTSQEAQQIIELIDRDSCSGDYYKSIKSFKVKI